MAKRCDRCLMAFDDATQTCPYCGSYIEQDHRSFDELSKEGYTVSHRLLSPAVRSTPQDRMKPVRIDVDEELERLRRGYEMSAVATEASEHERESGCSQQGGVHGDQSNTPAVSRIVRTDESSAAHSVDELIDSLRADASYTEAGGHAVTTNHAGADTTELPPPIVPGNVEWDNIEALSEMRERADREYRRTVRRETLAGFLSDLTTPGTVQHWIATALFLILCVWLFIVYVLPAMVGAVVVTLESLLPYLIVIGLLIYIYRLLIHP